MVNHSNENYDPIIIISLSTGAPLSLFSPGKTFTQQPYNSLVVFDSFDIDVQCSLYIIISFIGEGPLLLLVDSVYNKMDLC